MACSNKFIYVFDTDARDELVKAGFTLLRSDARNNMFVFAADNNLRFAFDGIEHVLSNTLSF